MNTDAFRFKLGAFDCAALSDGAFNYPPESLFATVPRQQVAEALRQRGLPPDRITTPYTCLLVTAGRHRVLFDTGAGGLWEQAARVFPGIDHTTAVTGKLPSNLRALGIEPSEIDTVVITHAHPDHVGGTLDAASELVYPNAHYFIARDEWEFWPGDAAAVRAPAAMVNIARHNLVGLNLDMVFLVKRDFLVVLIQWRRRLPRASQNNTVVLGTLQPGTSPRRRVKDVAPLASAKGVLDAARVC